MIATGSPYPKSSYNTAVVIGLHGSSTVIHIRDDDTTAKYVDFCDIPDLSPPSREFDPEQITKQQNKAALIRQWKQSHRLPVGRRRSDVVPRRRIHRHSAKG